MSRQAIREKQAIIKILESVGLVVTATTARGIKASTHRGVTLRMSSKEWNRCVGIGTALQADHDLSHARDVLRYEAARMNEIADEFDSRLKGGDA